VPPAAGEILRDRLRIAAGEEGKGVRRALGEVEVVLKLEGAEIIAEGAARRPHIGAAPLGQVHAQLLGRPAIDAGTGLDLGVADFAATSVSVRASKPGKVEKVPFPVCSSGMGA
jgi:hypothetical protein